MAAPALGPVLLGSVTGLVATAMIALVAWLNSGPDGSDSLRAVSNFFASVPTLALFRRLSLPASLEILFFLVYGALVGAVLGWLFRLRRPIFRLTAAIFVALLLVSHWAAYVQLVGEIRAAVRALGDVGLSERPHDECVPD